MALQQVPKIAKYLSVVMLFAFLGRSTVWNFLPVYFEMHIQSVFIIGILTSLPAMVTLFLDIPVSNYIQRVGEKFVFFTGLLIGAIPAVMYFAATPAFLFAGKFVEGINKSLIWNSGWSLSLKSSDQESESQSVSVFLLGVNLAAVLGPILGGYLILTHGFNLVFGLWFLTSILSVLVFISYIGTESKANRIQSFEELFKSKTYSNDFKHLKQHWTDLKPIYTLMFLFSIIFGFFWLAVPLLLEELGASYVQMGIIFGAAALPSVFQFIFGDIADHIGRKKTLLGLSIILTPVLLSMFFVESILLLGVLFFLASAFTNGMSPAIHAMFDEKAPEKVESELVGFLENFKHFGQLIGPIMAGAVSSVFSLSASFGFAAIISGLIMVYSIALLRF